MLGLLQYEISKKFTISYSVLSPPLTYNPEAIVADIIAGIPHFFTELAIMLCFFVIKVF
jgi:hypothetical protein